MKHPEADALARELAQLKRCGLTEAVRFALAEAVRAEKSKTSLVEIAAGFRRELAALRER